MTTEVKELRDKVRRGALLLDEIVPGWEHRVNLDTLQMHSSALCILGQLFGIDAETAIGKEMYPELWEKSKEWGINGYVRGKLLIGQLKGITNGDIWYAPIGSEENALINACCHANSSLTPCMWVEEVADRRARYELSKDTVAATGEAEAAATALASCES